MPLARSRQPSSFLSRATRAFVCLVAVHVVVWMICNAGAGLDALEAWLRRASDAYEARFGSILEPLFLAVWSLADIVFLAALLVVQVWAVPAAETRAGGPARAPSLRQKYFQFRISTLLIVTLIVGGICAIGRIVSVHPLVLIDLLVYLTGPWAAQLCGEIVRLKYPEYERAAVAAALVALLAFGASYVLCCDPIAPQFAFTLRELVRITAWLWCPQIVLYLLLRPLILAPRFSSTAGHSMES